MASCLRSSSNIARLSRRGVETFSRQRLTSPLPAGRTPLLSSVRKSRQYATVQPGDPKDPKKDDKKATAGDKGDKPAAQQGKQAPGMEHIYNKSSPLSNTSDSKSTDAQNNASKLSEEDEKTLQEMATMLKRGMPEGQRQEFDKALAAMKQEGMPDELKDVLKTFRGEKSFNLATAAKVIRIITRLARRAAEIHAQEEQSRPQQKSGAHDPGPAGSEGKDKKKGGAGGGQGFFDQGGMKGFKWDSGTFISSAIIAYLLWTSISPGQNSKSITWQEFKTRYLDRGLVEKLTVLNKNHVRVSLNREAVRSVYPDSPAAQNNFYYYFTIGDVNSFERHLDEAQDSLSIPSSQRIPVSYEEETPIFGTFLTFAPTLLLIGGTWWLLRRSGGGGSAGSSGIFGMGRSRAKKFNHESDIKVTFKDVAGMDEAKVEIMEFVSFLKEPGMYQKLGAKIPRGAILSGPPGTGKTLLAKATAGESKVPFFSVSGSEFVEMFVGVGASRVRDMFSNARKNAPCIIFIDEIDAIGKARGKNVMGGGNDEREATLNQILTEMDGFNTTEQIVVLAGTNRPDVLDKALMRPGRFDRHIAIDRPTMDGRKQIFAVHLKNILTNEDQEYLRGRLSALTPGFSGADIANCVNEAALIGK